MLTTIDRFGIRKSIFLPLLTVLVLLVIGATILVISSVGGALEHPILQRSLRLANLLAAEIEQAPLEADAALVQIDRLMGGEENGSAFVLQPDGNVLAERMRPGVTPGGILAEYHRHGSSPCFSHGAALWCSGSSGDPALDATGGAAGSTGGETKARARVWVGLSTASVERQVARIARFVILALAGGGALVFILVFLLTSRFVFGPMSEMREVARRVSECDLTARVQKLADDEMGSLSESLNRIGENLTVTLSHVKGVAEQIGTIIQRIGQTGTTVAAGVGTVSARVVETGTSMGEMISSLKGIAIHVETLAQSAEESSSSILEMAATNDEVSENIKSLAASVAETTAAIEQMTFSIKEVAKNIEALSATAEETSSSMNEMDLSISQVESNANETAKLSEQAQRDAEMGAEALSRTLAGIDKIKGSSKEAANVIEALGKKIATVGNILSVIDDVAEQTNLLALNAAILAAQSGEHGKGFAVVADEIKDLAERTGASTKEISDLIRSVQEESKNAIQAMDRGVKNVEEGVHLGQDAESALKKIQESSEKSTQMVKAIARATIEQARGSKHVTMAIHRIAETVQQIATATAEQARGSEQIMKSAEKMKIITKHVERSSEEQARGSKQITRSIEAISEMVNQLNRSQNDQDRASDQVMNAVVAIKRVAEAQTSSVQELEEAIADLIRQADALGGEVKRFKL